MNPRLLLPFLAISLVLPAQADPYNVIRTITHTENALWYSAGGNLEPIAALDSSYFVIATKYRRASGGVAYVFDATDGSFLHQLTASDAADGMDFGATLSVDGGRALIGAHLKFLSATNRGKAYLYDLANGTEIRTFSETDGDTQADEFGKSVAIDGTVAVVGAPRAGVFANGEYGRGLAYAFNTTTGTRLWTFGASDWEASALFGEAVAVKGNDVLVGAPFATVAAANDAGKAYVYDLVTGNERFILVPSDPATEDYFGSKVSITEDYFVVASPNDDDGGGSSGSVYLFDRSTGAFVRKFGGNPAGSGAAFGHKHSVSGEVMLASQSTSGTSFGFYDLATGNRSELVSDPTVYGSPAWKDNILIVARGGTAAPDAFTLADGNFTIQVLSNGTPPATSSAPSVRPAGKRRITTARPRLTLRGTATDIDGDLARVEVKVGNQPFVAAKGTTIWSVSLKGLKPGKNTIQIRSKDAAGNTSATVKLTVVLK